MHILTHISLVGSQVGGLSVSKSKSRGGKAIKKPKKVISIMITIVVAVVIAITI